MSVVVVFSDERDAHRAQMTLEQVRTKGKWVGELAWVVVGFDPDPSFVQKWGIWVLKRKAFNMMWLWQERRRHPFQNTDGREMSKLIQFSKWRVLDEEFKPFRFLLYMDAGMHVQHPIAPIFSLGKEGHFVAPDDRFPFDDPTKNFRKQWETVPPDMEKEYGGLLDKGAYFLNCMWLMDTCLIQEETQDMLMGLAKRFPYSRTNEMAIMNLFFLPHWIPLPEKINNLVVFDWTERFGKKTRDYILLKYPHFP